MQEGESIHGKGIEYMGLAKNFPKDVQERLAPRLDNLPLSGKRVFGCVILVFLLAAMLGIIIYAGVDGIRQEYSFGCFLLTKTHFFQHYLPETEGCAGWQDFGFNRKEQIRQCIIIPVCCLVLAGIFTYIK